jgi:hypothetical protein
MNNSFKSTIGYGKKAANILKLVQKAEGKKYVDVDTWRVHKSNDPNFVYNSKYMICVRVPEVLGGPVVDDFRHFIGWLEENPVFLERARNGNPLDDVKEEDDAEVEKVRKCNDGYSCTDTDCNASNHFCKKHVIDLRESETPSPGAIEGNCIYCCFEGRRFNFQWDREENDWSIADIALAIIQLGFADQRCGFTPVFSTKPKRSVVKIIEYYNQGVEMAKK